MFICRLKVTVTDLTVLRCGTIAVTRRIWLGPRVITPVSATKPDVAALAVESELIRVTKPMPKTSAIDNVILRFIIFSSRRIAVWSARLGMRPATGKPITRTGNSFFPGLC